MTVRDHYVKMFSNTLSTILLTTKWLLLDDRYILKQYLDIHDKRTLGNTFHGFTSLDKQELGDSSILVNFCLTRVF